VAGKNKCAVCEVDFFSLNVEFSTISAFCTTLMYMESSRIKMLKLSVYKLK
jgi:hypothetical protein